MQPGENNEVHDKDEVYRRYFDRMQRAYLKTLINDDVIEEYRKKPLGQHSEPLERLLIYFRRVPQADKYAIKRDTMSNTFRIIAFSGVRGEPPRLIEDREYGTIEEAYHGVFLKRVEDLMES